MRHRLVETSPKNTHGAEQRRRALELRLRGKSCAAIGAELGISRQAAHKHVKKALDLSRAATLDRALEYRRVNSERTDALIESLWDKREDPRTADTLLRAIETQAKLEGAFAPQQFEVGQPGAYDLSKLTDDELATAEALARKALPSAEPHVEAVSEDKEPA